MATVFCEMCLWHYQPRTRNGIAKAIREHWSCGFSRATKREVDRGHAPT